MNIKLTPDMVLLLMQGTVVHAGAMNKKYVRFNSQWYLLEDDMLREDLSDFPNNFMMKETVFLQDVLDLLMSEFDPVDYLEIREKLLKLPKNG